MLSRFLSVSSMLNSPKKSTSLFAKRKFFEAAGKRKAGRGAMIGCIFSPSKLLHKKRQNLLLKRHLRKAIKRYLCWTNFLLGSVPWWMHIVWACSRYKLAMIPFVCSIIGHFSISRTSGANWSLPLERSIPVFDDWFDGMYIAFRMRFDAFL